MKDYILKPGSFIAKSSVDKTADVPGLSLEKYIVSVINNPTCCPKNLGGGGIEGTMLATATATGTPEENGISAFNAYKSVRDNSYFLRRQPIAATEIYGDISQIYFHPGLGQVDGAIKLFFHNIDTSFTSFADGKIYAFPVGPNRDEYIYGQYVRGGIGGVEMFKYVAQPGELSGRIPGFIESESGNIPNPFTFNINISQAPAPSNQPIYEVELVKPTVLLPPGEYVWPAMVDVGETTMIDSPVNFVGLDKHSTILSNQSNMIIAYGYAFGQIFEVNTGRYITDRNTPYAQSIVFSNLTYSTNPFNEMSYSAYGEVKSNLANAIIFDNCNIKGSIGNFSGGVGFSFAGFFNCDIYPSVLLSKSPAAFSYYKFEGCNFVGDKGELGTYGDSTYLAGFATFSGNSNQFSLWSFDSNSGGKNVWFGNGTSNLVEANRTNFRTVLAGNNSFTFFGTPNNPNIWNYVNTETLQSAGSGSVNSIVNYSVANNAPWPV